MPDTRAWIIPPSANVMFCFGEIDCRFHIIRKSEANNSDLKVEAEKVAGSYIDVISEIKALGYNTAIWNAVPPTNPARTNKEYPHYGSYEQRKLVTKYFNNFLKEESASRNIHFVDIYDRLLLPNGNANLEFFSDEIHLSQKAMPFAIEELKKVFPAEFSQPDAKTTTGGFFKKLFK